MTKLQKKLERQAKQQDRLLTGYSLSQKSSTSRNNGIYKFTFADRIKL